MNTTTSKTEVQHLPDGQIAATLKMAISEFMPDGFTDSEWIEFTTAQSGSIEELSFEHYDIPFEMVNGEARATSLVLGGDEAEAREPIEILDANIRSGAFISMLEARIGFQGYGQGPNGRTSCFAPDSVGLRVSSWHDMPAGLPRAASLTGHQREAAAKLLDAGVIDSRIGAGTASDGSVYFAIDAGGGCVTAFVDACGSITSMAADSSDYQEANAVARLSRSHPIRLAIAKAGVAVKP